jgi:hypothetical protein
MNILKQSTAATIKLGPFIDDTDGKTAETGLTIAQADVRLSKNGGDFAQKNSSTSATHDENGYYDIPLNATDTGTLGRLRVAVSKSGALPVWQDFLVVTANVYDTLCSTDSLDVTVTALANDVIKAASFDESTAFPLTSADSSTTRVARVGADGDTLETLSDEIATVQADLDNPDQYKADVSGIPAAVWAYTTRTLSSFGTLIADIWAHTTRTLSAFGFTVATNSDANVSAIKAKTDNLPANPAPAGEYDTELAAIQADLNNPDQYKADVSGLALESTLSAIKGAGWTDETLVALMNATEDTLESLSNEIATKMATAENIEGTYTLKDAIRIILAFAAGKVSGGGTSSIKFRSTGDDVDRIQATVDSSGNRTAVTLNPNDPV